MNAGKYLFTSLLLIAVPGVSAQDTDPPSEADSAAALPATNWTDVNLAITDAHVIPSYNNFAEAAAGMDAAAQAYCAQPGEAGFEELQDSFHMAMDSWQQVQHLQFGPITYFNWNYRIQFWPDDNGTASRQLTALIASKDSDALTPDAFSRQSVGVQGLQALEILLFSDDAQASLQTDPWRCQLVRAISGNINEIARGVATRWIEEFRTTVANADDRGFFESAEDATIDYLKALVETVRRLQEQKLEAVIGANADAARVRRAESWRSGRSLRNLKLNLDALGQLFSGSEPPLSSVLHADDVELIDAGFARVQALLMAQPDSLVASLERSDGHAALLALHAAFDALFEQLEAAVKNTDLYLGFNSLDGD